MAKQMPKWLEDLIIKGIKEFLPASAIAEAIEQAKIALVAKVKEYTDATENKIDDFIVAKFEEMLSNCTPDSAFLCDLINRGEDAVIEILRAAAKNTATGLDDVAVELLAKALKS